MIIYLDTSALAAIYLGDHANAAELATVVYHGQSPVVTSELTDVEITSALARARRDGTIDAATMSSLHHRYQHDTSDDGPIGIIPLHASTIAAASRHLSALATFDPAVTAAADEPAGADIPLRTLGAIHLAAATQFADTTGQPVQLCSLDARQNAAAHALGIATFAGEPS